MRALPAHVLVVEDNMLIAMDAEDSLRALGVESVTTAGSVAAALAAIEGQPPELAIVDYDLGNETSDAVADELVRRQIPFALASGYDELAHEIAERGAFALLGKPYGKTDIANLLAGPKA